MNEPKVKNYFIIYLSPIDGDDWSRSWKSSLELCKVASTTLMVEEAGLGLIHRSTLDLTI